MSELMRTLDNWYRTGNRRHGYGNQVCRQRGTPKPNVANIRPLQDATSCSDGHGVTRQSFIDIVLKASSALTGITTPSHHSSPDGSACVAAHAMTGSLRGPFRQCSGSQLS